MTYLEGEVGHGVFSGRTAQERWRTGSNRRKKQPQEAELTTGALGLIRPQKKGDSRKLEGHLRATSVTLLKPRPLGSSGPTDSHPFPPVSAVFPGCRALLPPDPSAVLPCCSRVRWCEKGGFYCSSGQVTPLHSPSWWPNVQSQVQIRGNGTSRKVVLIHSREQSALLQNHQQQISACNRLYLSNSSLVQWANTRTYAARADSSV